ncbi:hypothetical protein PG984_007184 [Apiospora sp. TS-2023a]
MATATTRLAGISTLLALQLAMFMLELTSFLWHRITIGGAKIPLEGDQGHHQNNAVTDGGQANEVEQGIAPVHLNMTPLAAYYAAARDSRRSYIRITRQLGAPVLICIIGISFVATSFAASYGSQQAAITHTPTTTEDACQDVSVATVDADIGGEGIRIALWAQVAVLITITLMGTFQCHALGVKEIGAGLAITHLSLAIALAVQMKRNTLTSADAIVGSMLLDSQGSAMSIQLMAKEVLAARWQVRIIVGCQSVGLVLLTMFVAKFDAGEFTGRGEGGSCFCVTAFWWGWIGDCSGSTDSSEAAVFWIYLSCRFIGFIQSAFLAVANMGRFDRAEKWKSPLSGISFPELAPAKLRNQAASVAGSPPNQALGRQIGFKGNIILSYDDYPATVSTTYLIHAVFSLTSMAAAHKIMHAGLEPSSGAVSVGQMIAIVVAVATILRACWLLWRTLNPKRGRYVWPFRFNLLSDVLRSSMGDWGFTTCKEPTHNFWYAAGPLNDYAFPLYRDDNPGPYRLGAIFSDPGNFDTMLFAPAATPFININYQINNVNLAIQNERSINIVAWIPFVNYEKVWSWSLHREYHMQHLRTLKFYPQRDDMLPIMDLPKIGEMLQQRGHVYIMTGLRIAYGLKLSEGDFQREYNERVVFSYEIMQISRSRGEIRITDLVF